MKNDNIAIESYIAAQSEEKQEALIKLRGVIANHLPTGFQEMMSYGMIGYVVPFETYPSGYHCNTKLPLPFLNIAAQKNFIAIYHMGIYADEQLMQWFLEEYPKHSQKKLDMGKSCIRFKKMEDIPFNLIGELVSKMSVSDWIKIYETNYVKK